MSTCVLHHSMLPSRFRPKASPHPAFQDYLFVQFSPRQDFQSCRSRQRRLPPRRCHPLNPRTNMDGSRMLQWESVLFPLRCMDSLLPCDSQCESAFENNPECDAPRTAGGRGERPSSMSCMVSTRPSSILSRTPCDVLLGLSRGIFSANHLLRDKQSSSKHHS